MLRATGQLQRRRTVHAAEPVSIWLSTRIVSPAVSADIPNLTTKISVFRVIIYPERQRR